jgi:hypothetical protein
MWIPSERWRLLKVFLAFAAVQALGLAAILALTLHGPSARGARTPAPTTPAAPPVPTSPQILGPLPLDGLRVDAYPTFRSSGDHGDKGRLRA